MKPSQKPQLAWRRGGYGRSQARGETLSLTEIVILRRLRNGDRQAAIADALSMNRGTVSKYLRVVRERFGVTTNADLLALPRVQEQLNDGTEAEPC